MIEQRIKINLNGMGTLILKPERYSAISMPNFSYQGMEFHNIPEYKQNNVIPIQFNNNPSNDSANIILQEETRYQLYFKFNNPIKFINFPILQQFNNDFNYSIPSSSKDFCSANLNTGSYAGKSFIDIELNGSEPIKIPFFVHPKKLNFDHYSAMISYLCQTASGIVFDSAPVFESQELKDINRETFYEDFIFFEYLFRPENLISSYEHIRRDPYKVLKRYQEPVPITLATNVGPSELINMASDSGNLDKAKKIPARWPEGMKDFIPNKINQSFYEEIVDNPENQFVKFFMHLTGELIQNIVKYIDKEELKGYAVDKIFNYQNIIQEYLLDDWLDDVGDMHYFPSNSQILQKKSGYRDILSFFMVLESAFYIKIDGLEDLLKGYQRKLYDLYEYWCYIKLFEILSKLANIEPDYNKLFVSKDEKEWLMELKRGIASKQKFKVKYNNIEFDVKLLYNRLYKGKNYLKGSYSLSLKPDYTIIIKSGEYKYLIHFDAKYRSDIIFDDKDINKRDKEEDEKRIYKSADIYKMHTYKDAIKGSLGAYVLYPGDIPKIYNENETGIFPSIGAFPLKPNGNISEETKIEEFIYDILDFFTK